ncbi:MAG: hypothetical protein OEW87_12735 [Flavobacteriaceae bacterium]|nr:hypothetical protein [Flavobacteriaceae bacterium]
MDKGVVIKFKILIALSIVLTIFLLVGQTFSLINYDLVVSLGLQESIEEVTSLGIDWAKAFALGDTLAYIPFLIMGIIGLIKKKRWGLYSMFGSLAISVYWPIVNLSAIYIGRNSIALNPDKYISFSIILPLISIYGLWGLWYLYRNQDVLLK